MSVDNVNTQRPVGRSKAVAGYTGYITGAFMGTLLSAPIWGYGIYKGARNEGIAPLWTMITSGIIILASGISNAFKNVDREKAADAQFLQMSKDLAITKQQLGQMGAPQHYAPAFHQQKERSNSHAESVQAEREALLDTQPQR